MDCFLTMRGTKTLSFLTPATQMTNFPVNHVKAKASKLFRNTGRKKRASFHPRSFIKKGPERQPEKKMLLSLAAHFPFHLLPWPEDFLVCTSAPCGQPAESNGLMHHVKGSFGKCEFGGNIWALDFHELGGEKVTRET